MLNKVILMGRLVADPEFRQTTSGVPVCRIRIAVDRPVRKDQERQADFINITCWRNTAEFVSRYFTKGKMIIVEGSLRNNDYTDNNGVKHFSMEVQADNVSFGESRSASQGGYGEGEYSQRQQGGYQNGGQQGGYGQQSGGYQQGGQGGYAQSAPPQRPAPPAQEGLGIGDIGDFEEILSDGEVPF